MPQQAPRAKVHAPGARAPPAPGRRYNFVPSAAAADDRTPSPRAARSVLPETPSKVPLPDSGLVSATHQGKASCSPRLGAIAPPPGLELVQLSHANTDSPLSSQQFDVHCQEEQAESEDDACFANEEQAPQCGSRKNNAAAARASRVLRLVSKALKSSEAAACADAEGFVSITKLMRIRQQLQREAFGSTQAITSAVELDPRAAVRLDKNHRRLRLKTPAELVRSIAELEVEASPGGHVPLGELLSSKHLRSCLRREADPAGFARAALEDKDSAVVVSDNMVMRRPRGLQLQRAAEMLLSDEHLEHDSRLRAKLADCAGGALPLTWLCSRYMDRLGVTPSSGARSAEVSAAELCQALQGSARLDVDSRRLTVRRIQAYQAPAFAASGAAAAPTTAPPGGQGGGKEAKAAAQLRQLLDFYFEPFTLQHNRYLLDLLARRVGPPEERGPWVAEVLLGFQCQLKDLMGLGRIASVLAKAKVAPEALRLRCAELQHLRHLSVTPDSELRLQTPLEVRSLVAAAGAPADVAGGVVQYLSAAREQRGQAPPGTISVVSYAVGAVLADATPQGQQRDARVKRQLVMHHSDLVCLQGADAEGRGEGMAATLSEDGYAFACARGDGEANSIFWDRSRWERVGERSCGAALAVDLRLIEDPKVKVRAVCLRPQVPYGDSGGLRPLLDAGEGVPIVACADLTLLGGAEGAAIVEGLACMESAAQEVLGEEISTPIAMPMGKNGSDGGESVPLRSGSNGLNKLRCADAVLFRNLAPVVVLSGHTEGYLATMAPEEVVRQFPAFRLPVVAAFDWRRGAGGAGGAASAQAGISTSQSGQRFRL